MGRVTTRAAGTFGRNVSLGGDLTGPVSVEIRDDDAAGYKLRMVAVLENGRYVVDELSVTRRAGGPPVTGEALRSIPVTNVLRTGVQKHFMRAERTGGRTTRLTPVTMPDDVAAITANGPTDEALRWVADIYRAAYALGDSPTQAVEQDLQLARSTAGRWVSLARKRGFLDPAEPGKAGV